MAGQRHHEVSERKRLAVSSLAPASPLHSAFSDRSSFNIFDRDTMMRMACCLHLKAPKKGAERNDRASNVASQAAHTTREVAHRGQELAREQPLVIAGPGIAFGAALAGTTPVSRTERQLVGEPASELMGELQQRANQIKDRVENDGRAAAEDAQSELAQSEPGQERSGTQGEPRHSETEGDP